MKIGCGGINRDDDEKGRAPIEVVDGPGADRGSDPATNLDRGDTSTLSVLDGPLELASGNAEIITGEFRRFVTVLNGNLEYEGSRVKKQQQDGPRSL